MKNKRKKLFSECRGLFIYLDDTVDIVDVKYLLNYILYNSSGNPTLFQRHKLDINTDGFIDILDITSIINIILD